MVRHYLLLLLLAAVVCAGSLFVGSGDLADPRLAPTFLALRTARLAAAFLAGAALAVGGVVVQGLFKNPLASPSILGTSAGADLGGKLALLGFDAFLGGQAAAGGLPAELLLPLGCVAGAVASLIVLMTIHRASDDHLFLLLAGFLLSTLLGSLSSFLTSVAAERPELARAMVAFGLGDLSGVGLRRVTMVLPLLLSGCVAAFLWARPLDLLLAGTEEATALGVSVNQVRWSCVIWTGMLTAAAVAVGANVAFVGLIVPHALRPWIGVQHRRLVPASALLGGTFLVACDVLARTTLEGQEIPLGVVTGLIGAPLFLTLLVRSRREATA